MTSSCCVLGVGFLGIRIAGELSRLGFHVKVFDHDLKQLRNVPKILQQQRDELVVRGLCHSTQNLHVELCENLSEAVANVSVIFEAIVENVDVKRWLFQKVTHNCQNVIICSNTLTIDLNEMVSEAINKECIIGCRFMTPVYCIPFVEISLSRFTSHKTVEKLEAFFQRISYQLWYKDGLPRKLTPDEIHQYWNVQKDKLQCKTNTVSNNSTMIDAEQESSLTIESICVANNSNALLGATIAVPEESDDTLSKISPVQHLSPSTPLTSNNRLIDSFVVSHNERTFSSMLLDGIEMHNNRSEAGHHGIQHLGEFSLTNEGQPSSVQSNDTVQGNSTVASIDGLIADHNTQTQAGHITMINETEGERQSSDCVICKEMVIDTVITPCGHMWLCYSCAKQLKENKQDCPACRASIGDITRVFKA